MSFKIFYNQFINESNHPLEPWEKLMNTSEFQGVTFEHIFSPSQDDETGEYGTDYIKVFRDGKQIGEASCAKDSMQSLWAHETYPQLLKPNIPVYRIGGIQLDQEERGKNLGKYLYMLILSLHPDAWYYNSQAYKPAAMTLNALKGGGLIELHTMGRTGDGESGFGVHFKRITPTGQKWLARFAS